METRFNDQRDLQGIVRRAKTSPDKTGSLRRNALRQLIEATHASSSQVKIYAANSIPDFFQDFPDLEEEAINAVYDLCEDQVMQVRMEGYRTLALLSKSEKRWIKRNADVLVQLLQSDEPNEVNVVKKALVEHLHMDPRITLGVLCDQLRPSEDAMVHDDTTRLRKLVINFLAGEVKKGSLQRIVLPDSDSESTLIGGLISAIPKSNNADVEAIVNDILLQLPSFGQSSNRALSFVQAVLKRAKSALDADLYTNEKSTVLDQTRPYFDILSKIFIMKRIGSMEELLKFYNPLISKTNLQKISAEDRTLVIYYLAEAVAASPKDSPIARSILGISQTYFEYIANSDLAQEHPIKASLFLLRSSLELLEDGWQMPSLVLNAIQGFGRVIPPSQTHSQEIQGLIRSITSKAQTIIRKRASSSPNTNSSSHFKSLPSRPPSATLPRRPLGPSESLTSLPGPSRAAETPRTPNPNLEDRPTKKARKSGDATMPSLLSRLSAGTVPTKKTLPEKDTEISIKGAASRNADSEDQTSLMARRNGAASSVSAQMEKSRKRKKGSMQ